MSKIGAKIQREKQGKRYYSKRPKAEVLEDRCQTNSEPLIEESAIDTQKFKSNVKEVYLGREVVEPKPRETEPLPHSYVRRVVSALVLAALVFWFVLDIPNCQSLPHAF